MAVYNTVSVAGDTWVNVNTAAGVTVGNAFNVQNISMSDVYLVESATLPTNTSAPILYNPSFDNLSKASVDAGSLALWAKCVNASSVAQLAIYD